jgi:hypothetical protein
MTNCSGTTSNHIVLDTDYFNDNSFPYTTKPGYSAYEYPHPLIGGVDEDPPGRFNSTPGSQPSGTTQSNITLDTSESATCRYDTSSGTAYDNMVKTFTGGGTTSHSATVGSIIYTDNFDRANENPLNSNWTKAGTNTNDLRVVSNEVIGTTNLARNAAYYSAGTFGADQYSEVSVDDDSIGPAVRIQTGQSYLAGYTFREGHPPEQAGLLVIYRYLTDGTGSTISSVSGSVSPGDVLRLEMEGTTLTPYKNDVEVPGLAVVDTTFTTGYPGIYTWVNTVAADDWEGGGLNALSDGNTYNYYVRCSDIYGNKNTDDYLISFSVQQSGPRALGEFTIQGVVQ